MAPRHLEFDPPPGRAGSARGRPCRCAWGGCASAGEFRAPMDRHLRGYHWLCLEHVRLYNASWDFHQGLSAQEMEAEFRSAATWDRPTWKLGMLGGGVRSEQLRTHDPFGFADDMGLSGQRGQRKRSSGRKRDAAGEGPLAERAAALHLLELTTPFSLEELKRSYKALVKKHHPDANGGSRDAEAQMKAINQAYQTLRATFR